MANVEIMSDGTPVIVDQNVPFYLVWTKSGANPRQSHNSWDKADKEAKRLAAKFPGKKFFVVQAKERVYVPRLKAA